MITAGNKRTGAASARVSTDASATASSAETPFRMSARCARGGAAAEISCSRPITHAQVRQIHLMPKSQCIDDDVWRSMLNNCFTALRVARS